MSINVSYTERPMTYTIAELAEEGQTKRALALMGTLSKFDAQAAKSLANRLVELKVVSREEAKVLAVVADMMAHFDDPNQPFGGEESAWFYAAKAEHLNVLRLLARGVKTSGRNTPDKHGAFPLNYLLHDTKRLIDLTGSSKPQGELFLGHVWGIKGIITTENGWSFSLEGATTNFIAQKFERELRDFIDAHRDHPRIGLFEQTLRATQAIGQPLMQAVDRILQGEPTFIPCELGRHQVVIGINGKDRTLAKGNRGAQAEETRDGFVNGLRVYKIGRPLDRLTLVRVLKALEEKKWEYFETGIDEDLELEPTFQIETKASRVGNCCWAAFKLFLRWELGNTGDYKYFTEWIRLKVLADYADSTLDPNEPLLEMVDKKFTRVYGRSMKDLP